MKRRILALVMCVVMAIGLIGTASAKLIQSAEVRYTMNNRTYKRWAELDINSSGFVVLKLHIPPTSGLEESWGLTGERTSPLKRLMGTGLRL